MSSSLPSLPTNWKLNWAGELYSFISRDTLSRDMDVQSLGKANFIIVGAFPIYRSLVHLSNSLTQSSSNRLNSDQNDSSATRARRIAANFAKLPDLHKD
jgi:hypothetical protein